jgi:ATP-dependent phosphofructokinase / diphosphate-dependent phosphofructokinase
MSDTKMRKKQRLAIIVGGGPAPGINGVISAATIEACNRGFDVIGLRDGFKWIAEGDSDHITELNIENTSRIHNTGGSVIGISRANPTSTKERMQNTLKCLKKLRVKYLITIGGDGTIYLASRIEQESRGSIKIAHVPKTIDNNIALPGYVPTFGYETARHIGTELVHYLMEDARTTSRWYFVVSMGRKTGHLALGIGKAAGATLTIIPEEFGRGKLPLSRLVKILEGSIIKRLSMGRGDGVAILAEGLIEKLDEDEIRSLKDMKSDEHGRLRLSEADLGQLLKFEVLKSLQEKGIVSRIVDKRIGYELRSAPPIPFDAKYTRDLGYSAVKFLLEGKSGAVIIVKRGKKLPIYFNKIIDRKTGRVKIRYVDINTESFEVAQKYMIKLTEKDLLSRDKLRRLSGMTNLSPGKFKTYFSEAL